MAAICVCYITLTVEGCDFPAVIFSTQAKKGPHVNGDVSVVGVIMYDTLVD